MDNYLAAVKRHASNMAISEYVVDTIYFGGGTPTVFGSDRLCSLLHFFKNTFNVDKDAEITVEANP